MRSADFTRAGPDGRAAALAAAARSGQPAGVLAYDGEEPAGWCSIAPRDTQRALVSSRVIPLPEGERIWSVACFFLAPAVRGKGLALPLLEAACAYAAGCGAAVIEAYPWPGGASYRYMGTRELYLAAGFRDVPVPEGRRPVMRRPVMRRPAQPGSASAVFHHDAQALSEHGGDGGELAGADDRAAQRLRADDQA
jgi:GNAT superfamily N-acetyltransferase